MWKSMAAATAVVLLVVGARQAKADPIYTNGPIDGQDSAWLISGGDSVTDSFTVTSSTTVISATVGLWLNPGDTATSVDWSIGSTAFGSDEGSGTASALSNTFITTNGFGADVYSTTFSLSSGVLAPGTYWLTLADGGTSQEGPIYWDQNSGPSTAYDLPSGGTATQVPSESFMLNAPATVPEPSTLVLTALGALVAGAYGRRG